MGLLLLFSFQGLGWLAFSPNSPGFFPHHWSSLSFTDWAKWFLFVTYGTYACETASCFVADSRSPLKTLFGLKVAAWLMIPVYLGGSWVVMRLGTNPEFHDSAFLNLLAASQPFWGKSAGVMITFLLAASCLLASATVVSNCPRISRFKDSVMLQVTTLMFLLCGAVWVGWLFDAKLHNSENLAIVLLMIVAFVGVAIACWTSLPQVVAIAEARVAAEHLFTVALDGILVVDDQGIIQQANPACESLFGLKPLMMRFTHLQKWLPELSEYPEEWTSRTEHTLVQNSDIKTIEVSIFIDEQQVMIRFIDNGIGIPEKLQKFLFDPFFTTKPIGKGTGLGLSISYKIIIEKHKGKLNCISAPGKGTEFIITIPLQQPRE